MAVIASGEESCVAGSADEVSIAASSGAFVEVAVLATTGGAKVELDMVAEGKITRPG